MDERKVIDKSMITFEDIRNEPYVVEHIMWDIEPKDLMDPVSSMTAEGVKHTAPLKGYIFYIETAGKAPVLYLMRHTAGNYAETLAQIAELPQDLLLEALEENKSKMYSGMCPINNKIKDWLKKELGVL